MLLILLNGWQLDGLGVAQRSQRGTLRIPSALYTPCQPSVWDGEMPRSLRNCEALSLHDDDVVVSLVVGLRQPWRPVAVFRRVGAVVIATFYRIAFRTHSHVCVEGSEIASPSLAYGDPSSAVVLIGLSVRVVTALFRMTPHAIFVRAMQAVRALASAAALLTRAGQGETADLKSAATVTDAYPANIFDPPIGPSYYTQLAEPFASQVHQSHR